MDGEVKRGKERWERKGNGKSNKDRRAQTQTKPYLWC